MSFMNIVFFTIFQTNDLSIHTCQIFHEKNQSEQSKLAVKIGHQSGAFSYLSSGYDQRIIYKKKLINY